MSGVATLNRFSASASNVTTSAGAAPWASVCQAMSSSIACTISLVAKPMLNLLVFFSFATSVGGHRLPRLVMLRVVREDLRVERPVFVELRGKLDEVRRDVRAAEARVVHVREHRVQRVPELVEHGRDLVIA